MRRELLVLLLSVSIFGCAYPERTPPTKTEESDKEKSFSSVEQMKYDELVSFLGMAGSGQWGGHSYNAIFPGKCQMEYQIAELAVSEEIITDLPAEENGIQKRKTYQVKLGALNPNDVQANPTYGLGVGGETSYGILEVHLRLPSSTPTMPRSVREWRPVSIGPSGSGLPPGTVRRPEGFVLKDGSVVPYTARGYFVHDDSPIDGLDFQIKPEVRSEALRVKQAFEEIIRLCGGKDRPQRESEMWRRDR